MDILDINQHQNNSLHLYDNQKLIRTALTSYQSKNFSREKFNLISENFCNAFNFTAVEKKNFSEEMKAERTVFYALHKIYDLFSLEFVIKYIFILCMLNIHILFFIFILFHQNKKKEVREMK